VIRTIAATVFIAAIAMFSTACSDDEESPRPATSTTSVTATSVTSTPQSSAEPLQPAPSASVRTKPGAAGSQITPSNDNHPSAPCEGTICTNPNHGAGTDPQENGGAVIQDPQGGNAVVPCEGTICTNPNHGAGN